MLTMRQQMQLAIESFGGKLVSKVAASDSIESLTLAGVQYEYKTQWDSDEDIESFLAHIHASKAAMIGQAGGSGPNETFITLYFST